MLEICQFPCLHDNYGYLIRDQASGQVACIDTPDAQCIEAQLAERGWLLTQILNTHHHFDHTGGNEALKARYGCVIVGPSNDRARIPGIDVMVGEGEVFKLGETALEVLETPGHTTGHIVYYSPTDAAAFVGDTLFSLGCGRLFEGTPEQMWSSLQKIMRWPDATRIYCAHEYTEANARFAITLEPDNAQLTARFDEIKALRAKQQPTVPSTLGMEKATNPFLRPHSTELQQSVGAAGSDAATVFAKTRALKDQF